MGLWGHTRVYAGQVTWLRMGADHRTLNVTRGLEGCSEVRSARPLEGEVDEG